MNSSKSQFRCPKYRFHKARNCAVVSLRGRDFYLGEFDSPQSWEKYHRLIAEHLSNQEEVLSPQANTPFTVTELIAKYWQFAKTYYVKNGIQTSEISAIKLALKHVRQLYGTIPASEFSPKKLKVVREAMIRHEIGRTWTKTDPKTGESLTTRKVYRKGLARRCINKLIARVKRMFAWGVEEELVGVEIHAALQRVRGLKKGGSAARETERIRPVSNEHIVAILPIVPPAVCAMIQLQQLSGGRPQDIVQMRLVEIDRTGPTWEYRPRTYKTQHHESDTNSDTERVLFFGPQAQTIILKFVSKDHEYLFCPSHSEAARNARRKLGRVTPMTPSQAARKPIGRKLRPFAEHYSVSSYRIAIRRACIKAGIEVWCPNQLRHSRLTEIRKLYGLEVLTPEQKCSVERDRRRRGKSGSPATLMQASLRE